VPRAPIIAAMSRAVILGGGGPVGIGWQAGLAEGLAGAGVVLADADTIIGTSAGAVVGAHLALRARGEVFDRDVGAEVTERLAATPAALTGSDSGLQAMLAVLSEAAARGLPAADTRAALARLALETVTPITEAEFVDLFADLADRPWPAKFRCTAVDAATGEPVTWDAAAGADLQRAVASSCAVPAVCPPVTVNGRRYADGGVASMMSASLAAGHDTVIAVSVMPLALPEGLSDPLFDTMAGQLDAELGALRSAGAEVALIGPGEEFLRISGWGLNLMNGALVAEARQAGLAQAATEAPRVAAVWNR
jgi:NTE family protein